MIRLGSEFERVRTIRLDQGVTVTFKTLSYLDFKELEARAWRLAQDIAKSEDVRDAMEEVRLGEREAPEILDRIDALANQFMLDAMVQKAVTGWTGVLDGSDNPLPFTRENWILFRDRVPYMADQVYAAVRAPMTIAAAEGNGSAPSPNGAPEGASDIAQTAP